LTLVPGAAVGNAEEGAGTDSDFAYAAKSQICVGPNTNRTVNRRYEASIRATAEEIEPVKIWTIICARLFVWRNLIGTARRLGPAAPQATASPSDLRSKGAACL
jgi:hypothetical protein